MKSDIGPEELIRRFRRLISIPPCKDEDYAILPAFEEARDQILAEQKGRCYFCRSKTLSMVIHAIRPDGPADKENLVGLCPGCDVHFHWVLHCLLGYRHKPRFLGR